MYINPNLATPRIKVYMDNQLSTKTISRQIR